MILQIMRPVSTRVRTLKRTTALGAVLAVMLPGIAQAQVLIEGNDSRTIVSGDTLNDDVRMSGVSPRLTIEDLGTLDGDIALIRGTVVNDGTITGGIDTTGGHGNSTIIVTVGATGVIEGAVNMTAGVLTSSGALNNGLSLGNGVVATIQTGGTVNGGDSVIGLGTLNIDAGGAVNTNLIVNGGQNGGIVNNSGTIAGDVTVNGGVVNSDNTIVGAVQIASGGTVNASGTVDGGITLDGGTLTTTGLLNQTGDITVNGGRINVTGGNLVSSGDVTNAGVITLGAGRVLQAVTVNNSGRLILDSSASLVGDLANTDGTIDMTNGVVGDTFAVTGNVSGITTIRMDIDLTNTNAGTSDLVTVSGSISGDVRFRFTPVAGDFTLQNTPIVLVDAGSLGAGITTSMTGIPQNQGLFIYNLETRPADGDIVLTSGINPAVGGVVGAFNVVQGLIGTIVNRPSGAFVSGIAFDAQDNCSTGAWARAVGGRATARASTVSTNTGIGTGATARTTFSGIQGGVDFGCFEAFDGGWDVVGGALFGHNRGSFVQNSFGLSTDGDFSQSFAGVYMNASTGNFSGELQLRHERSKFDFVSPTLGLNDSTTTRTTTLSGSASYRYAMDQGYFLIPTTGFGIGRTTSGSLSFDAPGGGIAGTLQPESHTSRLAFIGATLGRTIVDEATNSATTPFITATAYNDFSSKRRATFTSTGGGTDTLTSDGMGSFGELSLGVSYARVLNSAPSGIRQLNANIRADYRFNNDIKGASVTAQLRLQF